MIRGRREGIKELMRRREVVYEEGRKMGEKEVKKKEET